MVLVFVYKVTPDGVAGPGRHPILGARVLDEADDVECARIKADVALNTNVSMHDLEVVIATGMAFDAIARTIEIYTEKKA
jgi:hypothetical protein